MTVDVDKLRALLAAVPCAECWGHGPVSGCIETSQRAPNGDIYGLTLFEPDEVNKQTIAEAELACAAVNALPELLAIAAAALLWRHGMVEVSPGCYVDSDDGNVDQGLESKPARNALIAAVDAARKAGA